VGEGRVNWEGIGFVTSEDVFLSDGTVCIWVGSHPVVDGLC
jgi:hypothetical protein